MGKVVKVCSVFNVSEIQPATRRSCELTRGRGPPQAQAAVVTAQEMVPSGSRSEPDPETPGTSRSNPTRLVRDEVAPVRGQPIQPSMGPSDQSVRGDVEGHARGQSSLPVEAVAKATVSEVALELHSLLILCSPHR